MNDSSNLLFTRGGIVVIITYGGPTNQVFPCVYTAYLVLNTMFPPKNNQAPKGRNRSISAGAYAPLNFRGCHRRRTPETAKKHSVAPPRRGGRPLCTTASGL